MDMTLDVMAHSLIYWAQELVGRASWAGAAHLRDDGPPGALASWPHYGPVSPPGCARIQYPQLAAELAPHGITANSIRAGVTDTPALQKIPAATRSRKRRARNPGGRLTTVEDVAKAIVVPVPPGHLLDDGNVIGVDGAKSRGHRPLPRVRLTGGLRDPRPRRRVARKRRCRPLSPAIDPDHVAGHPVGVRVGQDHDGLGDVFHRGERPPGLRRPAVSLIASLPESLERRRIGDAGADGVGGEPLRSQLGRQLSDIGFERSLGGGTARSAAGRERPRRTVIA